MFLNPMISRQCGTAAASSGECLPSCDKASNDLKLPLYCRAHQVAGLVRGQVMPIKKPGHALRGLLDVP